MKSAFQSGKFAWAAGMALIAGAVITAGCSNVTSAANPVAVPEVEVVRVEQKDVPIYREWIGTLDGMVNAAIKAQVTGYLLNAELHRGFLRPEGTVAVRDRSAAVSGGARSGAGTACAGQRTTGAGQGAIGAGGSAARASARRISEDAAGCRPLHSAREAAGHHAAGSGQRHTEQSGGEGASAKRRKPALKPPRRRSRRRNAAVEAAKAAVETAARQSRIHPAHLADRRHRGAGAGAGGQSG